MAKLIQKATEILQGHETVLFAYLFGSRAAGTATQLSDIDIAVYLRHGVDPSEAKLNLLGDLMDQLQTDAVDLVVLNSAPLSLAGRVLANRIVLLDRDPHLRHSYESVILREFFDFSIKEQRLLERRFGLGRQGARP
jgi:predicted nucleotidyltransferase